MTISLPQKKIQSIMSDVSGSASESKDNSFRVNKGVTSPEKLHCRFLQQQQIQAPKKNGF